MAGRRQSALAVIRFLTIATAGAAIALIAWFPGHWLIALLALPAIWALAKGRGSATAVWIGYYLAGARDIPIACERFFAGHGELSQAAALELGILLWFLQAIALAAPWALAKPNNCQLGHAWRAAAATLLTCVPPLGIIGWLSPLHVASELFPGGRLVALLLGLAAIATAASITRSAWARLAVVPIAGLALVAHLSEQPHTPKGWVAVNSTFGKLDQSNYSALFRRSQEAMLAAQAAFDGGDQVVILPEEAVGLWRPAVRFWWEPFVTSLTGSRRTLVLGADLPVSGTDDATPGLSKEFRYTDSAIVLGATHGRLDSRQPVPGGLWRPGARVSARLGSLRQRYQIVAGKLVGFSICYEDYLLWPHWRLYLHRPDLLVSMANDWFASDLALSHIQLQSIESVARLSAVPLLRTVNR
ncbi:MAG: conjugal transfer protein TraB [Paraburkholderia sp.]|nr:MAG: conjugal transfer protein TraB [Paraburkholderia sp.]